MGGGRSTRFVSVTPRGVDPRGPARPYDKCGKEIENHSGVGRKEAARDVTFRNSALPST